MVEHRHPLAQGPALDGRKEQWALRYLFKVRPVGQHGAVLQHIGGRRSQYPAEAVGRRPQVIGAQAFTVLLAFQVKAGPCLTNLLEPSVQLCEVEEASVLVAVVGYLLGKLLLTQVLPCPHLLAQVFTYLLRGVGPAQVVCCVAVDVVQHLIAQRAARALPARHDAQRLTGHLVLMAVHPRQQAPVAEAVPLVVAARFVAERADYLHQRRRRKLGQERDVRVYLVGGSQQRYTGVYLVLRVEIAAQACHIDLGVRLDVQEQVVVRVGQGHRIVLLLAQHGDSHAVDVVAQVAVQVLVGIGRLHGVDSRHQSRRLVHGIAVHHNILDG